MAQSLKDFSRLDRAPIASFDVNAGHRQDAGDRQEHRQAQSYRHEALRRDSRDRVLAVADQPGVPQHHHERRASDRDAGRDRHHHQACYDADHVAIRVADTGCGIPEENLSKIRDPFFTTKEVGTGTGLGLSIVDEIIRSHYGELLVESVVGKGSVFTVILPIRRAGDGGGRCRKSRPTKSTSCCRSRKPSNACKPKQQLAARPRLLFVDDEQRVLNSMRIMFRRQFDLFLASHGAEALDIVRDQDIDVIVADHRMPKMTGVEVLSKVRALSPRTVRILLTGYADLDAVEGSINESEVFRFLTKPCAPQQLRETIELAAKVARETPAPPRATSPSPAATRSRSSCRATRSPKCRTARTSSHVEHGQARAAGVRRGRVGFGRAAGRRRGRSRPPRGRSSPRA